MKPRFWELDSLRGIALIFMVIFHFTWNLNYFDFVQVSMYSGFWGIFQKITAGLFILLVGVVLTINYNRNKKNYLQKFLKRGTTIFAGGLLLTVFTFIFLREQFIYFGILHFIGVSIILSIPFIRKKLFNLALAISLIALPSLVNLYSLEIPFLIWLGFSTPFATLDFFPVIPWFGVVLLGIFLGNIFYKNAEPLIVIKEPESKTITFLQYIGKRTLLIYFLHQPILFSLVYVASTII